MIRLVVIAEDLGDRHHLSGVRLQRHRVAGLDRPFPDHAAVSARPLSDAKTRHKDRIAHPRGEGAARDARRGHFQHDVTDVQPVADGQAGSLQVADREVLAERAGREFPPQLGRPPGVIRAAVDVDRLVRPAVMPLADDRVAGQAGDA